MYRILEASVPPHGSSTSLLVFLGAIAAAAITGLITWRISRRLNSSNIDTSSAADLWQASESIRQDLRNEVESQRTSLQTAADRLDAATQRATEAERQAARAEAEAADWKQRALTMEAEVQRTKRQIATLQRQVRELRAERKPR